MLACLKTVYNPALGIDVITLSDGSKGITTATLCFYAPIGFLSKKDIARVMRIVYRTDIHSFLYAVLPGKESSSAYISIEDFKVLVRAVVPSPLKEVLLSTNIN